MADFQHGLCGCLDNCGICILTYFCPCYMMGKEAEFLGDSCCCCTLVFFVPILNIIVRTNQRGALRSKQGIDGGFLGDCLRVTFCGFCSIAQEANEIAAMQGTSMARQ